MAELTLNYDEVSDTLYISFVPGQHATGVELNEHILLRLNKSERKAVGLTIFDYSILVQPTEIGPRSFPLAGLSQLPSDVRDLVLEILRTPPVNTFLTLSAYTPSFADMIPIVSLDPASLVAT